MYCQKCGTKNSDEAVYCQKCGLLLEAEEETRVVKRETGGEEKRETGGDEREIFSISPTLKFVKIGYGLAAIGAILLVGLLASFLPSVSIWIAVLLGLALLLIPAFFHFKQKILIYRLTDSKFEIDEVFIFQN